MSAKYEYLGNIGRGFFAPTVASGLGKLAGCPFCMTRASKRPEPGSQIFVMNGLSAGTLFTVTDAPHPTSHDGWLATAHNHVNSGQQMQTTDDTLFLPLPLPNVPHWWPPFRTRLSFLLDELIVWFCNHSIVGSSFRNRERTMAAVCSALWHAKIEIDPNELVSLAVAHGLPTDQAPGFERDFRLGRITLETANGRSPVKKWRTPDGLADDFASAMRFWGR